MSTTTTAATTGSERVTKPEVEFHLSVRPFSPIDAHNRSAAAKLTVAQDKIVEPARSGVVLQSRTTGRFFTRGSGWSSDVGTARTFTTKSEAETFANDEFASTDDIEIADAER